MGKFQLNKKGEDPLKIYEDTFKIANDTVETHLDKLGKMPNPISESRASEYTMEDLERVGIEWDNSSVAERKEIIIDTHNGYTEGHDDNIVKNWNELSDHTRTVITQGKSNESKASEGVLDSLKRHREKLLSQGDSVNYEKYGDESKASEDWEDEESERVQKALDKMNADAYMKQLTKKGYNEESLASEDHPVEDITDVHVHGKNNSVDKVSGVDITVEEADNYKQKDFGNQNEWEDDLDELRGLGGKLPDNNALWNSVEAIASEEFDISKYYKEVMEDGWMDYQCNSCGKKIDPDDGYGDQKDYGVLIQELKDHQINHKFGESN